MTNSEAIGKYFDAVVAYLKVDATSNGLKMPQDFRKDLSNEHGS